MIRKIIASLPLVVLAASASAAAQAESARGHSLGAPLPTAGMVLQPQWSDVSRQARIFLVAGGRDSANFAQEIVDQRRFWMSRGYTAKQIECFFVAPPAAQSDDAEQFLSLAEELRSCHLAAPDIIFSALATVAGKYRHDAFYLYVTSHGTDPLRARPVSRRERNDPGAAWYVQAHDAAIADPDSTAYKWFSPFWLEVEGAGDAESWGWASFSNRFVNALQNPAIRVEDQLFTPRHLAQALQKFPDKVRKVVVLQACHSGGFLLPPDQAPAPDETLVNVSNITVLTAARADRTSFGCDTAEHTTYYGGALQAVLDSSRDKVPRIAWRSIHDEVSAKVQQLEADQKIPDRQRSLPQFYSNDPLSD